MPLEELVLRSTISPAGEVHITMRLRAIEAGCRIEMDEVATAGPPKLLPRVVQQGLFAPGQRSSHSVRHLRLLRLSFIPTASDDVPG